MIRYEKIKKIGEGSFGKALLVRRKSDRKQCVIKEINISRMAIKEKEESRKEVTVLSQLKHPNIVSYQESFEEFGNLMIVMDYCEGGDLYEKITNQRGINFSEDQVLDYFVQICLGLKHIHDRKILHRDLKSQNIFLTKHGIVKLGDFGIARVLKSTMELARTCIGTPYYLSPEICENRPYNNKSDIWSLGCVLYELCTLKHAFESGNMKNLVLKIIRGSYPPLPNRYSPDMRSLVARCFKRSPSERPSVNTILKKTFIQDRIRKFLSPEVIEEEFSHTIIHKPKPGFPKQFAPALAMGRQPAQAVKKVRDPAAIYGPSLARKPIQGKDGPSQAAKKPKIQAARSAENQVRSSTEARERRRKNLMANQEQAYQDYIKNIQKQRWEKQQRENISRAREKGWKNFLSGNNEPKKKVDPEVQNKPSKVMEKYQPKQDQKPPCHAEARDVIADTPQDQKPVFNDQIPKQRPISAYEAAVQGREASEKGNEAAERARVLEDFWQRKREAAMNKARGNQEIFQRPFARKPGGQDLAPAQNISRPSGNVAKNHQEQEYLKQLEAIRKNNFYERLNQRREAPPVAKPQPVGQQPAPQLQGNPVAYKVGDPRYDPEIRRQKIAALKEQADQRAILLREQLEKRRRALQNRLQQERLAKDKENENKWPQMGRPVLPSKGRPSSAHEKVSQKAPEMVVPAVGIDTAMGQLEKIKLFRSCSEGDLQSIKSIAEEKERKHWEAGGISPIAALPLEMTASEMEATSAADLVFKPGNQRADPRKCWNPDGKTKLISILHQAELATESTVSATLITTEREQEETKTRTSTNEKEPTFVQKKPVARPENCAFQIDVKGNIRDKVVSPRKSKEDIPKYGSPLGGAKGETYKVSDDNKKSGGFGATVIKRPLPPKPKLSDEENETESKTFTQNGQGHTQPKKAWEEGGNRKSSGSGTNKHPQAPNKVEKVFTESNKCSTPAKKGEDVTIEDIGDVDDSFHTPNNELLETRGMGLKTGFYDTDKKLLRTCSLPDLVKVNKTMEAMDISESNDSDNGSKKETRNERSGSLADDEGDDEGEDAASEINRGIISRGKITNGTDTGDAEDEADEEEFGTETQEEEEEEIQDLENMLNSMRHVLDSSNAKTPPCTTSQEKEPDSCESSPREGQIRSSLFEEWDSDEGEEDVVRPSILDKDEKKFRTKEDLFQRIEESRQALENELGVETFLKVYRYIQGIQENEDDELDVSFGPENEIMDLLGPEKERLYQKVLYLVMADAAYFEDNE